MLPTVPCPRKKALKNRYRVESHVHSPIFQGQLIEQKIRSITLVIYNGYINVKKNIISCFKQMLKSDTCSYVYFSKDFQKKYSF